MLERNTNFRLPYLNIMYIIIFKCDRCFVVMDGNVIVCTVNKCEKFAAMDSLVFKFSCYTECVCACVCAPLEGKDWCSLHDGRRTVLHITMYNIIDASFTSQFKGEEYNGDYTVKTM